MSDTPKTDAETDHPRNFDLDNMKSEHFGEGPKVTSVVPADFARQLERELAAALERIEVLEHALKMLTCG